MAEPRFQCPECKMFDTLYEDVDVPGWRSIDDALKPTDDRHVEWENATVTGTIGCSCGWQGTRSRLEQVGTDGEPLPAIHPDQTTLGVA